MADSAGITLSLDGSGRKMGGPDEPSRQPFLIVVLECSRPLARSARYSLANIHVVRLGRGNSRSMERVQKEHGHEMSIGIPDRWMSSRHAMIEHSFGRWVLEDTNSKNGTVVNGTAVRRVVLKHGDLFELGHTLLMFLDDVAIPDGDPVDVDLEEYRPPASGLSTLVPEYSTALSRIGQIAESEISILIEGESGTGKEVLARAIHELSGRTGEFVAVNCGAIPANLVESELFGHRKGAFSGAVDNRLGLVRSADKGTLFLDEIGDLPPSSQAALLRVLQEREVMPLGEARPLPVDLRVLAATHRDLDGLVDSKVFRRDLFARLAGFRVKLPPLRERREDIGMLVGTLFERITKPGQNHPGLECDALRQMFAYDWPLNVRELEQALSSAVVLAGDEAIALQHLPDSVRNPPRKAGNAAAATPAKLSTEDEQRRDELVAQLQAHTGNISAVARAMGKDRKQIQRWVKRFQLNPTDYK